MRGGPSARPGAVAGIGAGLVALGGVDSAQADTIVGYVDGIAIDNPGLADDAPVYLGRQSVILTVEGMNDERAQQSRDQHRHTGADRPGSGPSQARSRLPSPHPVRCPSLEYHGDQSHPRSRLMRSENRSLAESVCGFT